MRATLLTAAVLITLSAAMAEEPPPTATPDFPKLIKDLGDPSFQVREAASDALAKAGETARAPLAEAARSSDPEVQSRSRVLLETLDARRNAQARKAQEEAEAPGEGDQQQNLLQQELFKKLLMAQAGQMQVAQGGGVQIGLNVNGKQVQLDQDDLARLEAMKGRKLEAAGITCAVCPEALADQLRIAGGVLVQDAADKPAGMDLEKHDVIVEAAGAAVADPEALEKLLEDSAGKPLALTLYRKGEKKTVTITPPKP